MSDTLYCYFGWDQENINMTVSKEIRVGGARAPLVRCIATLHPTVLLGTVFIAGDTDGDIVDPLF
jgi:hypothetical protein